MQAKAVFREKFTFRPYSTKSQTHLKMTMSIAEKVSKTQKIQLIPVTDRDPEAARKEMTKVGLDSERHAVEFLMMLD